MASLKLFKGAAYDIAHHAQSGLSYLYPYVGELCKKGNLTSVTIKLMDDDPYPQELEFLKSFSLAVHSLVTKFKEIVLKLELPIGEVAQMDLTIFFNNGYGSLFSVKSTVLLKSGTTWNQLVE